MNHSSAPIPADLRLWEDVAGCFEAAAMAVALLRQVIENGEEYRGFLEKALDLTAEAQSALRMAVEMVDGKPDSDQNRMFHWLRQTATEEQIFIARLHAAGRPGRSDPMARFAGADRPTRLRDRGDPPARQAAHRSCSRRPSITPASSATARGRRRRLEKVIEAVDTLVGEGTPPSNTDLRDMLVPIVDDIPEARTSRRLPAGAGRGRPVPGDAECRLPSRSCGRLRRRCGRWPKLYKGKTMVLIGGDCRPACLRGAEIGLRSEGVDLDCDPRA